MTTKKLTLRQKILVAGTLFGMFFGAGNLIFPVHLGQMAGRNALPAIIGFIITAVGIPILGVAAIVANDAAREFYERHGARVTAPAFEIKPVEKADLMTCRHCIRAALKRCPKMLKAFPELLEKTQRDAFRPEPLVLVNSSGERFEAIFHCKADPCFMTITPADAASGSRSAG